MAAMNRILLLTVFITIFCTVAVLSQGHWETYTYTVRVIERQCRDVYYRKCRRYFWGLYKSCKTHRTRQCNNVPVTRTRTGRRCQAGWQPQSCTTAICTPKCSVGQVCKAPPQTCECIRSGGGACTYVPCGNKQDCYPGTCSSNGATCSCPPGFNDSNCNTMNLKPSLSACDAKIYAGRSVVAQSDCSADGVDPVPVWLSTSSPTRIQVSYRADFTADRTPRVDYVQNSPVPLGITLATFSLSLPTGPYNVPPTSRCVNNDLTSPPTSKVCVMDIQWTEVGVGNLQHKSHFTVTAQSQSGGRKVGNSAFTGGNFRPTNIVGLKTNRQMKFSVDLRPPTHCLLQPSTATDSCTCFPVHLDYDVTTNAVIEPLMCGWTDDASDVDRYHVEIYYMNIGGTGLLEETGSPLHTEDIRPPHNNFRFTCRTSGVYSIQLTVYDRANNSARARQLFSYDGESKMTINDVPVYVAEADESTDRRWINSLPAPRDINNYTLTVVWKGRYKSDARYADRWLKAAKRWTPGNSPCTKSTHCVDDNHGYSFGLRTVDKVGNATGILGYSVGFVVDSEGGRGLSGPPEYITVPATQDRLVVSVPQTSIKDGDVVVFWFSVSDMVGNKDDERLIVGLDRTVPKITADEFKKKTVDEFTSSAYISVKDAESGIKSITASIYDKTLKVTVWSDTRPSVTLQPADSRRKRAADEQCPVTGNSSSCYCIPAGGCFVIVQPVDIDNCLFDRYTSDPLELRYTVTNHAGLNASGTIDLGILTDINCRPVPVLSAGVIVAIVIGCILLILLLVVIALMLWRWRVHRDPLPPGARTVFNRTFRRKRNEENEIYSRGRSTEMKNRRDTKLKINNLRAQNNNNNVYKRDTDADAGDDDDDYGFVDSGAAKTISPSQVDVGKKLADGKFAVVKAGSLAIGNEMHLVAVKKLKRGFGASDRRLMTRKIELLSSVGNHVNIVRFVGSYDDPEEGPVMLLELCDMTLKDWLSDNSTVTADVLEDMSIFVLQIARAVEFLHSQQIVHRRLGVRNVLLKHHRDGLVAKLIGFGPADDTDEASQPLRWMSPESLTQPPTYNFKTDVWSYGITVWEIYSRGAKPYSSHRANQVQGLLARGYRMDRPTDCPAELFDSTVKPCWEQNASARPSFNVIRANIEQFRRTQPVKEDYYAAGQNTNGDNDENHDIYDDAY